MLLLLPQTKSERNNYLVLISELKMYDMQVLQECLHENLAVMFTRWFFPMKKLHLKILGSLCIVICREVFYSFWEFKEVLYPLNVYCPKLLIQMCKVVGSKIPSGHNFVLKDPNQNQWWHCLEEMWHSATCTSALIFENILSWPSVFIWWFFGASILQTVHSGFISLFL